MSSINTGLGLVQRDQTGKVTIIRTDKRNGVFIHLSLSQREVEALRKVL